MNTHQQPRQAKGQPVGGQYAGKPVTVDDIDNLETPTPTSELRAHVMSWTGGYLHDGFDPVRVPHPDGSGDYSIIAVSHSTPTIAQPGHAANIHQVAALRTNHGATDVLDWEINSDVDAWLEASSDHDFDRLVFLSRDDQEGWKHRRIPEDIYPSEAWDDIVHGLDIAVALPPGKAAEYPMVEGSEAYPARDFSALAETVNGNDSFFTAIITDYDANGQQKRVMLDDWDNEVTDPGLAEILAGNWVEETLAGVVDRQ